VVEKPVKTPAPSSVPLSRGDAAKWVVEFAPDVLKHESLRLSVMADLPIIPTKHLKNLSVRYDPSMGLAAMGEWGPSLAAYYKTLEQVVFHSTESRPGSFSHEVGHHVEHLNIRDEHARRETHESYMEARRSGKGFPSEYSKVDRGEFFAECYSIYLRDPKKLRKRNPRMGALLDGLMTRELVGRGMQKAATDDDEKDVIVDPAGLGQFNPYLSDADAVAKSLAEAWTAKDQLDGTLKPPCTGPSREHDVFTSPTTKLLTCANCERTWKRGEDPRESWVEVGKGQLDQPWERYTDYGSGSWGKLIGDRPELDTQEFHEYVANHNRADRDSGELGDIARFELDRLAEEFLSQRQVSKADAERAQRISQLGVLPVTPPSEAVDPVGEQIPEPVGPAPVEADERIAHRVTKAGEISVDNLVASGHRVTIEKVLPPLAPVIQYPKKLRKTAERDPVTGRITHVIEEVVED
jgi:hypothetical protein